MKYPLLSSDSSRTPLLLSSSSSSPSPTRSRAAGSKSPRQSSLLAGADSLPTIQPPLSFNKRLLPQNDNEDTSILFQNPKQQQAAFSSCLFWMVALLLLFPMGVLWRQVVSTGTVWPFQQQDATVEHSVWKMERPFGHNEFEKDPPRDDSLQMNLVVTEVNPSNPLLLDTKRRVRTRRET